MAKFNHKDVFAEWMYYCWLKHSEVTEMQSSFLQVRVSEVGKIGIGRLRSLKDTVDNTIDSKLLKPDRTTLFRITCEHYRNFLAMNTRRI